MRSIPRFFYAFCAIVFCFNSAQAAPDDASASGSQMAIELRDGSRVVGKNLDDSLNVHSALLDMKLSWANIRSIEFAANADTARLTATNGDVFTVQLAADTLNIETGFGKTELAVKLIRNIKVLPAAKASIPVVAAAAGETGSRLTVELRDGSRIVGKGLDDILNFHSSAMGDFKLAWNGIRSIEFTSTNLDEARLTATNGDIYEVQFAASSIRLETSFGKTELPVKLLRSLKISAMSSLGQMPSGLVALWSGEGDANDSVGGCNGQLMNGVQFTPGKVGQAFSLNEGAVGGGGRGVFYSAGFNRGGSFLLVPACPALDVGKEDGFTIVAWIKPANVFGEMLIAEYERELGTGNGSDVGVDFDMQQAGGTGKWFLDANVTDADNGTSHTFHSSPLVTAGVWQHVAFSYDKASGDAALYLNGSVVAHANFGSLAPQASFPYLLFGARTTYGSVSNPRSVFSGEMDEMAIYNRALSASEIETICAEQDNGGH
jgi:hypothetical protein